MLRFFLITLCSLSLVSLFSRVLFSLFHYKLFLNFSIFEILHALALGCVFDLSLSAYLISPLVLLIVFLPIAQVRKLAPHLAGLTMLILVFLHGANHLYFWESGRHFSYELRSLSTYVYSIFEILINYPLRTFGALVLSALIYFTFTHVFKKFSFNSIKLKKHFVLSLVILLITAFSIRGFFNRAPLKPNFAFQLSNYKLSLLYTNGAYNALYYIINKDKQIHQLNLPKVTDLSFLKRIYGSQAQDIKSKKELKSPNIIFILLESWPAHRMKSYGAPIDPTPFFDQLRKKSLSPNLSFAGGHRTSEGLFSIFCSYQNPLGQAIPQSQIEFNPYYCLPHLLRDKRGYNNAFFQGTNKETSGVGSFAQSLGFTHSFGKQDITTEIYEKNSWGFHDEDIYNFALGKIKESKEPFLFAINTNSTHDQHIPPNVTINFEDDFVKTLNFADQQLEKFFKKLENEKLLENTLFVLASDHTAYTHETIISEMAVPILIYGPQLKTQTLNFVSTHKDLAPTLLELMGEPIPEHFQGQSWLKKTPNRFADFFHLGQLVWFKEPTSFIKINTYLENQVSCYNYKGWTHITEKKCSAQEMLNSKDALKFNSYSQQLLFEGKTQDFKKIPEL